MAWPRWRDVRLAPPLVPSRRHPVLLGAKEHREEGIVEQERTEADRAVQRVRATCDKAPSMARAASHLPGTLVTSFEGWPTELYVKVPDCLGVLP
jgi:hypothetical protein